MAEALTYPPMDPLRVRLFRQLEDRGWTEDVLSIIPPDARLHETSRIPRESLGKVPGRMAGPDCYIGISNWTELKARRSDLMGWSRSNCNIGLQTRRVRAIDIDCEDTDLVLSLRILIQLRCGKTLWRGRANSARGALLYRCSEQSGGKRRLAWGDSKIEILGAGNQILIWGRHPSGVDYNWDGASPFDTKLDDLPELPEDDIPLLLDAIAAELHRAGQAANQPLTIGHGTRRSGARKPLGHADLVAADKLQAVRALEAIPNKPELEDGTPNTHTSSYEQVISIIAAFIGAVGGDKDLIDNHLVPWLDQWPGNDDNWIAARIESFRDGTEIGAERLFACARSWGFNEVTTDDFAAVPQEPGEKAPVVNLDRVREKVKGVARGHDNAVLPVSSIVSNPFTDQQIAVEIWHDFKAAQRLRYDASGQWYVWEGTHWRRDSAMAHQTLHFVRWCLGHIAKRAPEGHQGYQLAFRLEAAERAEKILKILRGYAVVQRWDRDLCLVNTPVGVVDLRTGLWRQAVPDDNLRSITPVAPEEGEPEVWLKAVRGIFDHRERLVQMLIDYIALCLLGERLADVAFMLRGSGRNGKSLILQSIATMLGDIRDSGYAYLTATPDAFDLRKQSASHSHGLELMDGARIAMFTEMPNGFVPDEALLKAAIAGENVTAKFIYRPTFVYRFTPMLLFASNIDVEFTSAIPALRHRFRLADLTRRFDDDKDFFNAVLADTPRLLSLVIRRATELLNGRESFWLKRGWKASRSEFERIERKSGEYLDLQDPIAAALRSLLQRQEGDAWVRSTDVLTRTRWALEHVRENYAEDAPKLDAALGLTDRAFNMKIALAMRTEFNSQSINKRISGQVLKVYHGVSWLPQPVLPFEPESETG